MDQVARKGCGLIPEYPTLRRFAQQCSNLRSSMDKTNGGAKSSRECEKKFEESVAFVK